MLSHLIVYFICLAVGKMSWALPWQSRVGNITCIMFSQDIHIVYLLGNKITITTTSDMPTNRNVDKQKRQQT